MRITTEYTLNDIRKVTQDLTQEAKDQVRLYRLSDPVAFIQSGMDRASEQYIVRDDEDYPIACAGVTHHGSYDSLFLVVSTHAIARYRQLCRLAVGWLGVRPRDVVVRLPEASTATLRMVERWGFKPLRVDLHGTFNLVTLVHEKDSRC